MEPRTPKEKAERPFRHGCVQAGHARIRELRREPLIRARSVRRAKGSTYGKYLVQARDRLFRGKRHMEQSAGSPSADRLLDHAVRRVNRRLLLLTLPVELLLTVGGFLLLFRLSQQLLVAALLAPAVFVLVRVILRLLIRCLYAPIDILVRREYERLMRKRRP